MIRCLGEVSVNHEGAEATMADNLEWTEQHPVSHIQWLPIDLIHGNDYNPNKVAQPEMYLLELRTQSYG